MTKNIILLFILFVKLNASSFDKTRLHDLEYWKELVAIPGWINAGVGKIQCFDLVKSGDIAIIRYLLESKSCEQSIKDSMFYKAIEYKNLNIAQLLLEHGAQINIGDGHWDNPLSFAINDSYVEGEKWLLRHGAQSQRALKAIINHKDISEFKSVLNKPEITEGDINSLLEYVNTIWKHPYGETYPLIVNIKCLLGHSKADPRKIIKISAYYGWIDFVQSAFKKGSVEPKDLDQALRALIFAEIDNENANKDILKLLLWHGASVEILKDSRLAKISKQWDIRTIVEKINKEKLSESFCAYQYEVDKADKRCLPVTDLLRCLLE